MPEPAGLRVEQLSTQVAYETPYLRLREDRIRRPDGSEGIYSYLEKPDFALIIQVEDGGFHLVEQYRYPVRARSWEFPQGTYPGLDPAADAEHLAREELRQETGLTARVMRHLGHLHCVLPAPKLNPALSSCFGRKSLGIGDRSARTCFVRHVPARRRIYRFIRHAAVLAVVVAGG